MTKQTWRLLALSAIPFVILVLLLWTIGFFDLSTDTKVVSSALALVGGLLTTSVTLFGLILRQSMEQRNADLRNAAEQRNADLRDDAEKRLKLEAGIKAVSLLGTQSGDDSSMTQRTGALFTMAHLGLIDLAIDLVRLMRPKELIEATAASSLLDMALSSNDPVLQKSASEYLRDQADTLLYESGLALPNHIRLKWDKFDYHTRLNLIIGIIKGTLARKYNQWKLGYLSAPVVCLIVAFEAEKDPRNKSTIAIILKEILNIYTEGYTLYLPAKDLKIAILRKQVLETDISKVSDLGLELADNVKNWMKDTEKLV